MALDHAKNRELRREERKEQPQQWEQDAQSTNTHRKQKKSETTHTETAPPFFLACFFAENHSTEILIFSPQ